MHSRRSKGCVLQVQLAGLDLGEVEDVVDDRQQRVAAGADDLGELALLGAELGVEQQAAHADDAVHGRADLVAHGGQEGALGLVGGLGLLAGALQLADVVIDADEAGRPAVHHHRHARQLHVHQRAVAAVAARDEVEARPGWSAR